MSTISTFDDLFEKFSRGESAAASTLFEEFTERLCALARSRLNAKHRRKLDPEDVIQSVYRSFYRRSASGEYSVMNEDNLWKLLAAITVWKCNKKIRDLHRAVRDVRREDSWPGKGEGFDHEAVSREPSPDESASLVEILEILLCRLAKRDREIVTYSLQGFERREVSRIVGCGERTVRRVLFHTKEKLRKIQHEFVTC